MTASMSDLLTVAKNIVTALNDAARQTLLLVGSQIVEGIVSTGGFLLVGGSGRLCTISVTAAGTTVGGVYDTNVVTSAAASNQLYVIPMAVGVYTIGLPYNLGMVIKTGTGQVVAISYSVGNLARGGQ